MISEHERERDSNIQNGIFRYFDAPFFTKVVPASQEYCSCCLCKTCSSLGQNRGNERAITGRKIIFTCPFGLLSCLSRPFRIAHAHVKHN